MATKKQYQLVNGNMVEQPFGSIPAVFWTDNNGNSFRAFPSDLLFWNKDEIYIVKVKKEIKPNGLTDWLSHSEYNLTADSTKYRSLSTGLVVEASEALDENGVIKQGYFTNGKFFTVVLGYNPSNTPISLFNFIYSEIAEEEGVTFS